MSAKGAEIRPVMIEIRPSVLIKGQIGLFAARALKKGTIIAEAGKLGEQFHPWSDYKGVDPITKKKIFDYCLKTDEGFYAPKDFNYLSVPWNMNHSCAYSVGFDNKGNFVTTRAIKKGEELYWDYGMGVSYSKYRLKCECKSKNCRKMITGNDWKDKDYRERNKKYFLRELLQEAKKLKV